MILLEIFKKNIQMKFKKVEKALPKYIGENHVKTLKTGFPDKWKYSTKKLADRFEKFTRLHKYQKPLDNLKKQDFFIKLKNDYLNDKELKRTIEIF